MKFESMKPEQLFPLLRCPQSGSSLSKLKENLVTKNQEISYSFIQSVPDLRCPPSKLDIQGKWYEPWEDLDSVTLAEPSITVPTKGLPSHLDKYLASVAGTDGKNKIVLEVGCGERQCEEWFVANNFRYVGTDIDMRGNGPNVLADAHNLPFRDAQFDFCTSMAVYEHLVSPITAAKEALRVLKPGGTFFGSSAFVFCFHDKASFHHMSHAGILYVLRVAGFEVERLWPDWDYQDAIPQMGFRGTQGLPWRVATNLGLRFAEWSYQVTSNLARRIVGKQPINRFERRLHNAGSVSFIARKPL